MCGSVLFPSIFFKIPIDPSPVAPFQVASPFFFSSACPISHGSESKRGGEWIFACFSRCAARLGRDGEEKPRRWDGSLPKNLAEAGNAVRDSWDYGDGGKEKRSCVLEGRLRKGKQHGVVLRKMRTYTFLGLTSIVFEQ